MPIYEYLCDDCGEHYERIVMSKGVRVTCPKCESRKQTLQLSVFAAPANGSKSANGSASAAPSGGCAWSPRGGCGCRH